jgi:hypothetical protein
MQCTAWGCLFAQAWIWPQSESDIAINEIIAGTKQLLAEKLISIKNNVLSLSKSFDVPGLHDAFDCNLFEGLETQHKQEMVQCKTFGFYRCRTAFGSYTICRSADLFCCQCLKSRVCCPVNAIVMKNFVLKTSQLKTFHGATEKLVQDLKLSLVICCFFYSYSYWINFLEGSMR